MSIGPRRTPGLRRDEVAVLAGVSIDYYTHLEQGRERHPSNQVVAALARALRLNDEATRHLYELARPRPGVRPPVGRVDQISPAVLRLIEKWDHAPAFVVNRRLDILARNRLAAALLRGPAPDNLIRFKFLDPRARKLYVDWEQEAHIAVADLRAAAGTDHQDPCLNELIDELSLGSADFRRLWGRYEVQSRKDTFIRFYHPEVGPLALRHATLGVDCTPGLRIFVAEPVPGSHSQTALEKLGGLMAADG